MMGTTRRRTAPSRGGTEDTTKSQQAGNHGTGVRRLPRSKQRHSVTCKFCGGASIVKNGVKKGSQYWLCKVCGRRFVNNRSFPGMKYPIEAIVGAVDAYYAGWSLDEIRRAIEQSFHTRPTVSTVYDWVARIKRTRINESEKYHPRLGDSWNMTCRAAVTAGERHCWLLSLIDSRTRMVVAARLSRTRNDRDALILLESAYRRTGLLPGSIVADGKWKTFADGVDLDLGGRTNRVQCSLINSDETARAWHRAVGRTLRILRIITLRRAKALLDGWVFGYNYLGSQETLGYKTPAEAAGIELPYRTYKQVVDRLYSQATERAIPRTRHILNDAVPTSIANRIHRAANVHRRRAHRREHSSTVAEKIAAF